ncbi:MAG TPA: TRC40/GET3/ArsA family transport-energizing ATPase [Terriglobales bacterium]|jgi:arsenite-transporting ATPase|nr:TRC40/GET3/ArsA family transport-energizing ATPase [Terriglobales bacterium]
MQLSFFIGKGGVGKTTVSSAFAVHSALRHPREKVLLISTDPAHSLADIFQLGLGDSPRRIPTNKGKLFGWQLNAEKLFGKFLDRHRDAVFSLLESGTIFSRREIEPLLSTHLPGMAEMGALMAIHDLLQSQKYDRLVVDTAPLGHTLRLFEMPEHFLRFLDFLDVSGGRDAALAASFGGKAQVSHAFLHEWRVMVEGVQNALRSPGSRLVLVTTAESFALQESVRAARSLGQAGLEIADVVLNRVMLEKPGQSSAAAKSCHRCSRTWEATRKAETFLKKHFPQAAVFRGKDAGAPILGTKELASYGAHVFTGKKFTAQSRPSYKGDIEDIEKRFRRCGWPVLEAPLALTIGKGGVGKTTISSALAFAQRQQQPQKPVTICSTDPAPSLDDVFQQEIGDQVTPVLSDPWLRAAELDSVAEFQRWSERIKETIERAFSGERRGIHVDMSFDRQLFSALLDIVPPGVDEIFAIFRILDLLENGAGDKNACIVIIDMAPTGHALELLRMPDRMLLWSRLLLKALAEHRSLPLAQDAAVEIAALGQRVRALARMLRDQRQALLIPVMLAEPLPDRETERLLAALKELGTGASPVFVNRVLFARDVKGCLRCRRAREWQLATLGKLEERLGYGSGERPWIVRNFPEEVAGAGRLQSFTHELWQLQRPKSVKGMRRSKAGTRKH